MNRCQWSLVIGHWPLVIGHWSFFGHWSLVIGQAADFSTAGTSGELEARVGTWTVVVDAGGGEPASVLTTHVDVV